MQQKPSYYSHSDLVMGMIGLGHWWTNKQIQLMTRGKFTARHTPTERVLKRKSDAGLLRTAMYGKTKIYALSSKTKNVNLEDTPNIHHELCSTETMIRFWFSKKDGELIPEHKFRGCGSVPDWGIRYPNKKMICAEFSTADNVKQRLKSKVTKYQNDLKEIEEKFDVVGVVVFILDVPRSEVKDFVGKINGRSASPAASTPPSSDGDRFPSLPFYFVDYDTLLSVPLGEALLAPIYFADDGKEYPLSE